MTEKKEVAYEKVPLRTEEPRICAVQTPVSEMTVENLKKEKKEKLQYLLDMIDMCQGIWKNDLLVFHEFPLSGFNFGWNREEMLQVAIHVPGPETEAIGEKAKKYDCYIYFGCYGQLPDWPNHFHNLGILIGPSGDIILKRWKLFNEPGLGFSTSVYDVLDEYVERYGWDEVFPVARTDIGNITMMPEPQAPEASRIFNMKGAEIIIRHMTGGHGSYCVEPFVWYGGNAYTNGNTLRNEFQATCFQGGNYGIFINNAMGQIKGKDMDIGSGGTAFFGPKGEVISEASTIMTTLVTAELPIAAYRKKRVMLNFPRDLYMHFYQNNVNPRLSPNSFIESQPSNIPEAIEHFKIHTNW